MFRISPPGLALVLFALLVIIVVKTNSGNNLMRKRREWILPPKSLKENTDYTQKEFVAKIRSDADINDDIIYSLEGVGANQFPFHVFVVDPKTGLIRVTKVLDREEIDMYNLLGIATFTDGTHAETKIDIRIKVVDENDNPPVFANMEPGEVKELSPAGTSIMKITATDADEPGNENSQIAYTIVDQTPPGDMFSINQDGTLSVKKPLDREKADKYVVVVKGQDLNGKPGGKTATGTVIINVQDVNDNLPTLEKEQYEGSIEENTQGVEVMRIKAEDLDLEGTDNWNAVFDIVKGNEAGYFSIRTDPKTNEGILMLDKAVDYEDVKNLELGLAVRNKNQPYNGGASSSGQSVSQYKSYPIKISVKNQAEGPSFNPSIKAIPISEGGHTINMKDVISRYPAMDGDTGKPAQNVRYVKGSDPGNWLTIDPETADIRLNKMPDRESEFLVNGTYYAKVLCISEDMPGKTATGTIAIQVEDFNDHCPILTSDMQTMCVTNNSVIVNAKDEDLFPNGPPFHFAIVPEGTQGKWQVEHLNQTAAILRAQESMWPGVYEVELVVKDEQGHACPEPQKVEVRVCTCEDGVKCGKIGASGQITKGSQFGPAGIGLLFLGLLLLLLIPLLLLFCHCGRLLPGDFTAMPFDTKSHLMNYHTEGQGENTDVPLLKIPTQQVDGDAVKLGWAAASKAAPVAGLDSQRSFFSLDGMNRASHQESSWSGQREMAWMNASNGSALFSGFEDREAGGGAGGLYDGMALPDHFIGQYYTQKVNSANLGGKDGLLMYDHEGHGSPAGSVGCCSLLENDDDLQFLNDLGPKFKTLAEVCGGEKIPPEVKPVVPSLPSTSINTQRSVSVVTTQQKPQEPQPPPQPQPPVPPTVQTVVKETAEHSQIVKQSTATVREGTSNPGQVVLLQQQQQPPVYLTSTPVLQPMHYVVQPQVQNTMLLAEAPATNLQGMVLVNSTQTRPAQSLVIQGQKVVAGGQAPGPGMVLVNSTQTRPAQNLVIQRQTAMAGGQVPGPGMVLVGSSGSNLIHPGNLSGGQTMMVVDGKVPAGSMKVVKGSAVQPGMLSGSQQVMVVGGPAASGGQFVQEAGGLSKTSGISGSQRVIHSTVSKSAGSQSVLGSSTTTVTTTPIQHKVVMKQTKEIH
ncbi:uncharacterized protein V6R79_026394 [Siganus canaliculatus]